MTVESDGSILPCDKGANLQHNNYTNIREGSAWLLPTCCHAWLKRGALLCDEGIGLQGISTPGWHLVSVHNRLLHGTTIVKQIFISSCIW